MPNGKIDLSVLNRYALTTVGPEPYVAPRSPTETIVVALWAELLGKERVSAEANFFALGGHSLMVGRLVSRLREKLKVAVPIRALFEHPVASDLARFIDLARRSDPNSPRISFDDELVEEGEL